MSTIFKHVEDLDESSRKNHFWDESAWQDGVTKYRQKLNTLSKSGVIGFIWPFGCGKTTFINDLKNDLEEKVENNKKEWWINFEAWKYPERKDLWESFILETATQIWEKDFKEIEKIIKGKQHNDIRILLKILNVIPIVKDLWWEAVSKGIDHFFAPAPLTRVYQFQNLLENIFLEKIEDHDTIFIVIEDIDRSWDHGVYFLETLNFFLKNLELPEGKKILAIATIWSKEFIENKDSYLKCLDYIHDFPIKNFDYNYLLDYFIEENFWVQEKKQEKKKDNNQKKCDNRKPKAQYSLPDLDKKKNQETYHHQNLKDFFIYIKQHFSDQFTTRTLKHILRELSLIVGQESMKYYFGDNLYSIYNFLILTWVVTSKYLFIEEQGERISYFDTWMQAWWVLEKRTFFNSLFVATFYDKPFLVKDTKTWLMVPKLMVYQGYETTEIAFFNEWKENRDSFVLQQNQEDQNANIAKMWLDNILLSL